MAEVGKRAASPTTKGFPASVGPEAGFSRQRPPSRRHPVHIYLIIGVYFPIVYFRRRKKTSALWQDGLGTEGEIVKGQELFLLWLLVINAGTFLLFGVDKRRAVRGRWRISERTLIGAAALGGSPGALLGMKVFHHKTRHKKFRYGIPVLLALQAGLVAAAL